MLRLIFYEVALGSVGITTVIQVQSDCMYTMIGYSSLEQAAEFHRLSCKKFFLGKIGVTCTGRVKKPTSLSLVVS